MIPLSSPKLPHPVSNWKRRLVVFAVLIHLILVSASLVASVDSSSSIAWILGMGDPYLQVTHFGVDERDIHLAHGNPNEQPLRLTDERDSILPGVVAGGGACDRQQRFLRTLVVLDENDQSSLISHLLSPLVLNPTTKGSSKTGSIVQVQREPTLLSSPVDDEQPPPYRGKIIRSDGESAGAVSLIQIREPRLNAIVVPR